MQTLELLFLCSDTVGNTTFLSDPSNSGLESYIFLTKKNTIVLK